VGLIDRLLSRRTRFPRGVNRFIDSIADSPTSFAGRIAARRFGTPSASDTTEVSAVGGHAARRVLIAPVNYSGQAYRWARALEKYDDGLAAATMALEVSGGFSFPTDLEVTQTVYHNGSRWQRAQRDAVSVFTHVLIEAEEPLFGRLFGRDVSREAEYLGNRAVNVAFVAHGTDIRLPSRHRERTEWSPYRDPQLYLERLERLASQHRTMMERSERPLFVSTPDLLADLPSAHWCPVAVDPANWVTDRLRHDGPLRVLHAPTSALLKGTDLIEPLLQSLHAQKVIEYRAVRGVPSAQMPALLAQTDVVLDQFRLGSYGVAACEAMAAGRVVVGHVMADVRDVVERTTNRELPIVEATPESLESILISIAHDATYLAKAEHEGPTFVSAVHDGRMSARVLAEHWISSVGHKARGVS
jgi:hypothetical protein